MDSLSLVTGIGLTVFLLFFLAASIDRKHVFLKLITFSMGVFMLLFIPQATIDLNKDCSISDNGTYRCFYPNGTSALDSETENVGLNFYNAFLMYLTVFGIYILLYTIYITLNHFGKLGAKQK